MDCTADVYAMGKVLHEMLCGDRSCPPPVLPDLVLAQPSGWDLPAIGNCLARACSRDAGDRYKSADFMLEDIEMRRQLPLESLLPASPESAAAPLGRRDSHLTWTPIALAALHSLPWVLGLLLAILLLIRFW
jgi:hypothetical protein